MRTKESKLEAGCHSNKALQIFPLPYSKRCCIWEVSKQKGAPNSAQHITVLEYNYSIIIYNSMIITSALYLTDIKIYILT